MKIQNFIIILFLSVIFPQFSTNAINGFGENDYITVPSSESMGGMWMYNNKINAWNPLLASSLHNTNLTMLAVSSSFQGMESSNYNVNNYLINFVNFSFPINKTTAFAIGLSPYTRTGYSFVEQQYIISGVEYSSPLASRSSHDIQGGISKLSLALSKGLFDKKLSIGIKWNVLFGNQKINSIDSLKELSYDQDGNESFRFIEKLHHDEENNFKAYLYSLDSKIKFKKSSFSFLVSFIDNFEITRNEMSSIFSNSKEYLFNEIQLDQFALGYMYNLNDNFGIAVEGHYKNSIDYPNEIMLFRTSYPSKISMHNGFYKSIGNSKADSWNSINLSAGYSYKIIKFDNQDLNDISFSLGTGISFNDWKNHIDISITVGLTESIVETIDRENYYKLNVAISSGDKWFEKRRRN